MTDRPLLSKSMQRGLANNPRQRASVMKDGEYVFNPNIPFSKKPNARYGPAVFHAIMMGATALGVSIFGYTAATRRWKAASYMLARGHRESPCGKWMLDVIKQVRYDYMLTRCLKMADRTVMRMKRHGMLRMPVDVAIDKHTIPRYDKIYNMLNIITSKSKNGTYHFNCLATINCTVEGSRAFLGATLVRRMDSLQDTVSKLIDECTEKGIRIGMLTVDREFFSTGVIGTLRSKNVQFLMPATQTKGVKKAISEFNAGKRDAVSQHILTSSVAGKEPEKFTLIILERDDRKGRKVIHAFATSVPVDVVCGFKRGEMTGAEALVEQYRARWSIETGYRCIESMRPKTTSREESVRVLLLFTPILLFNAWILALHLLQRANPGKAETKMTFKMVLEFFMLLIRGKTCPSLLTP